MSLPQRTTRTLTTNGCSLSQRPKILFDKCLVAIRGRVAIVLLTAGDSPPHYSKGSIMARKTPEQEMIENAPVVEQPTEPTTEPTEQPTETDTSLEAQVSEIFRKQFGNDGEPLEGETRWADFIREQVIEADALEGQYRTILTKKEANRTLLRALGDMEQVPTEIANFYYPPRKRKTKAEKDAENAS